MRATLFPIAIGISVGQLSLATLWGACSGRTWLQGILFVTFLAIMQNVLIGYRLDTNSDAFFNVATYTPALFLISCLPLLILRQLKGWTLSFDKSPYIPKSQFGVEDILVICVVVAATMVFFSFGRELTVNTIQSRWANSISNLLSVGALSAIANLLILPFTFFAFRIRTCFLRLPLYCIAGAIAWIAAIGYFAILDPRIIRSPEFWSLLTGTLTATVVVYAGLKVIRFSGMQLTRYPTLVEMKSGIEVPRLSPRESSQIRNRSRGLAVGIIVCVMISNLAFARSLNTRIDQDKKLHSMILELEQQGGSCKEVGNQVTGLRLGKQATDSTVNEFRSYSKLQSLSLADSQVTDVCLKTLDQFPMLLALDLSGTNVTAAGLKEIPPTIKDLSLARTQLSPSELRAFLESRDFTSLDLSGLRLSDADLISMVDSGAINGNGTLKTLSLADNPITDVSVNRLMSGNVIYSLDFSGTNVDGSGIPIGSKTDWLTLDRTNVNDSTIAPFVASMKLSIKEQNRLA